MSEDISKWIINHSGFKLDDKGHWRELQTIPKVDDEDNKEWVIVSVVSVPVDVLLTVWEGLVRELSDKEVELYKLKEAYLIAESNIVNETDFKALYGANNQKVRDNHVKAELSDMVSTMKALEFGINWIRSYIPLLKEVIRVKQ